MLTAAIESWRKEDRELGLSVRPREADVRAELQNLYEKLSKLHGDTRGWLALRYFVADR